MKKEFSKIQFFKNENNIRKYTITYKDNSSLENIALEGKDKKNSIKKNGSKIQINYTEIALDDNSKMFVCFGEIPYPPPRQSSSKGKIDNKISQSIESLSFEIINGSLEVNGELNGFYYKELKNEEIIDKYTYGSVIILCKKDGENSLGKIKLKLNKEYVIMIRPSDRESSPACYHYSQNGEEYSIFAFKVVNK